MDPLAYVNQGREGSGIAQVFNVTESRQQGERAMRQSEKDLEDFKRQKREADAEMRELMSVDLDGWDVDVQREIYGDLEKFQDEAITQYKNGVNVTGVTDWNSYSKLMSMRKGVEKKVNASKAQKAAYDKALAARSTGKFVNDEVTAQQFEAYRNATIEERGKMDLMGALVVKVDPVEEAKKIVDAVPVTDVNVSYQGTGLRGLSTAVTTEGRDLNLIKARASSLWETDPVLQRNTSKENFVNTALEIAQPTKSAKPVRYATEPTKEGSGETKPKPSTPVEVSVDDLKALGKLFKTDGTAVQFNENEQTKSVDVSTLTGGKTIKFTDPVSGQELDVAAGQIIDNGGMYYLVANVPSMKEDASVSKETSATTSGEAFSENVKGIAGTNAKGTRDKGVGSSSIKTSGTQKSVKQTYVFPLNDYSGKLLLNRLGLAEEYSNIDGLFNASSSSPSVGGDDIDWELMAEQAGK